jgi:hypothetical protein
VVFRNHISTVSSVETRAQAITSPFQSACDGETITLPVISAPLTVIVTLRFEFAATLDTLDVIDARMIAFIGVPAVPIFTVPFTSSFAVGVIFQIDTSPAGVIRITSVGTALEVPLRLANTISHWVFQEVLVVRNPISAG